MQMGLKNLVHLYSKKKGKRNKRGWVGRTVKARQEKPSQMRNWGVWQHCKYMGEEQIPCDLLPGSDWVQTSDEHSGVQELPLLSSWCLCHVVTPGTTGTTGNILGFYSRSGLGTLGKSYTVHAKKKQLSSNLLKQKEELPWICQELWLELFYQESANQGSFSSSKFGIYENAPIGTKINVSCTFVSAKV